MTALAQITHTPLTPEPKYRSSACVCVCVLLCKVLDRQNKTSAKKSNHISSSQKALQGPSHHIALFLPTGKEQDKTAQLNFHFKLSQPAVVCCFPLRHHRSTNTAAMCISCSGDPTLHFNRCTQMQTKSIPLEKSTCFPAHSSRTQRYITIYSECIPFLPFILARKSYAAWCIPLLFL